MIINLKTKPKPDEQQRFAVLIEPEFIPTPKVHPNDNDAELYRTCKEHGVVRIAEFDPANPYRFNSHYTVLTPDRFEAEWMGDMLLYQNIKLAGQTLVE